MELYALTVKLANVGSEITAANLTVVTRGSAWRLLLDILTDLVTDVFAELSLVWLSLVLRGCLEPTRRRGRADVELFMLIENATMVVVDCSCALPTPMASSLVRRGGHFAEAVRWTSQLPPSRRTRPGVLFWGLPAAGVHGSRRDP